MTGFRAKLLMIECVFEFQAIEDEWRDVTSGSQTRTYTQKYRISPFTTGATVAERLQCSPPTNAKPGSIPGRVSPGFSQVGIVPDDVDGFSRGSPVSPALAFGCHFIITSLQPDHSARRMINLVSVPGPNRTNVNRGAHRKLLGLGVVGIEFLLCIPDVVSIPAGCNGDGFPPTALTLTFQGCTPRRKWERQLAHAAHGVPARGPGQFDIRLLPACPLGPDYRDPGLLCARTSTGGLVGDLGGGGGYVVGLRLRLWPRRGSPSACREGNLLAVPMEVIDDGVATAYLLQVYQFRLHFRVSAATPYTNTSMAVPRAWGTTATGRIVARSSLPPLGEVDQLRFDPAQLDEEHCTLARAGNEHLYAKTQLGKVKEAAGIAERRMEGARVCEAELVANSSHQTALGCASLQYSLALGSVQTCASPRGWGRGREANENKVPFPAAKILPLHDNNGEMEVSRAHNPEVSGSKPLSATIGPSSLHATAGTSCTLGYAGNEHLRGNSRESAGITSLTFVAILLWGCQPSSNLH
ncbi:hypothetical protein PR048_009830 [Dryococelus australis]|uniref:Uncharacterized protein n=1 Tax=Dryococelus australis TaxID=614101 RepID=A0ABQ9I123_9NEOP|nr:hypothetical protein PR048_009830 [Dryococelus australis]